MLGYEKLGKYSGGARAFFLPTAKHRKYRQQRRVDSVSEKFEALNTRTLQLTAMKDLVLEISSSMMANIILTVSKRRIFLTRGIVGFNLGASALAYYKTN